MQPKTVQVNLRVPPVDLDRWRKAAESERRTLTSLVLIAVDGYLEAKNGKNEKAS